MPSLLTTASFSAPRSYRIVLALDIIHEHFGDITRDVAQMLLDINQATLSALTKAGTVNLPENKRLTLSQIKKSLLILWKFNCLLVDLSSDVDISEITLDANGVETKLKFSGLFYKLNVDQVLNRLRFGRLLTSLKETYGDIAVDIAEEIFYSGRLRYGSVVNMLENKNAEVSRELISEIFVKLVQERYLVVVPPLDLRKRVLFNADYANKTSIGKRFANSVFGDDKTSSANVNANKRSRMEANKTSSVGNTNTNNVPEQVELLPVELRMMLGEIGELNDGEGEGDLKRKRVEVEQSTSSGGRGSGRGRGRGRGGRGNTSSTNITATSSTSLPSDSNFTADDQQPVDSSHLIREEVYWMIGFDQLYREERHKACVDLVTDQLENMAGAIVRVIIQLTMNQELGPNTSKSGSVSIMDIFNKLKADPTLLTPINGAQGANGNNAANAASSSSSSRITSANLDITTLKKLLDVMRLSSLDTIVKVPGSESEPQGPFFMVNYDGIVSSLRRRCIQQIAQQRFGIESGRIIELLQRNKYLEQQTVSDRAILPARETRERLYRLYSDRWVNYVELSKRNDFNPSTNFYFWYLDLPRLKNSLLEHLYHAQFNLRKRLEKEMQENKDLTHFGVQSDHDQKRYQSWLLRMNVLENHLQKLDLTVLLMEKF